MSSHFWWSHFFLFYSTITPLNFNIILYFFFNFTYLVFKNFMHLYGIALWYIHPTRVSPRPLYNPLPTSHSLKNKTYHLLSHIAASCMLTAVGLILWRMENTREATTLKKISSPSPEPINCQYLSAQSRVCEVLPPPWCSFLTCTGKHSCCMFLSAVVLSWWDLHGFAGVLPASGYYHPSAPSSLCSLSPVGTNDRDVTLVAEHCVKP